MTGPWFVSMAVVAVVLLAGEARGDTCWIRTMKVCDPDTAPDQELVLMLTAREDTVIDVRLGPVVDGQKHGWRVQLATDRINRCLVDNDYWLANQTPCSANQYDQPRVSVAPRGVSFIRFSQCPAQGHCSSMNVAGTGVSPPLHRCEASPLPIADQGTCQENAVLLARNCSTLTVERVLRTDHRVKHCPAALNQQGSP